MLQDSRIGYNPFAFIIWIETLAGSDGSVFQLIHIDEENVENLQMLITTRTKRNPKDDSIAPNFK